MILAALSWTAMLVTCPTFDAGAQLGLDSLRDSEGDRTIGLTGQVSGGAELTECLDVPLRAELALGTTTLGPPWGDGVDAVEVKRLLVDLAAYVGWSSRVHERLGAEVLLGADARATRVSISAMDDVKSSVAFTLHPAALAGIFVTTERLRVGVRATIADLEAPRLGALVAVHLRL